MLYEFAMTPDLFDGSVLGRDKSAGIILVQLLRGLAENGLLANLHKDRWARHVTETRVATLPQELKDKVIACLTILHDRHRLVRHPKCLDKNPGDDRDWLNLALESHQRLPFQAIFVTRSLIEVCGKECESFVELFESLDSPRWTGRPRTVSLRKKDSEYRLALAPILRYAKSLWLIDPYLNSQKSRFFDTIKICSNLMGRRGHERTNGRIHIHADIRFQIPEGRQAIDYLNLWEKKLFPLAQQDGHRFKVFLWKSDINSETMHDRYIITDQCGISVPGGLDCLPDSKANSTDWSLMDEDARRVRLDFYDEVLSPFKLEDSREISKTA